MDPKPETPSLPLITRFKLWLASTLTNLAIGPADTIDRRYSDLIFKTAANSTPVEGVKSYDVSIDPARNLWFRVFVPEVIIITGKLPVIVYYHGGGFAFFSPDSSPFDELCRRFARMIPAVVVSASYRLTPENRYPSQYDDGIHVLKFLDDDQNRKYLPENADLQRCFVAGDSAGGNLAHQVCIRASQNKFQQIKVIGLVALQPFFGGEKRTPSELSPENSRGLALNQTDYFWRVLKPVDEDEEEWDRDNEVINVSGPRAVDISGLEFPATLVVVGGRDILQDWQRKYYDWLNKSGKEVRLEEYRYMFHGFYAYTEVAEAMHVISLVKDFVHNQIMNTSTE